MSVLEKIRSKTSLLVGIVGLALVIFILESLLGSGGALFSNQDLEVGKINGDKIDYPPFSAKVNEQIAQIQKSNPNTTIDDKTKEQIIESVWSQMINDRVIKLEYKKLGIANAKNKQILNNYSSSNELGSTMNIMLCDIENNILMEMIYH